MRYENLYRLFLGIALVLFAIRLLTEIRYLAVLGALFLLASALLKAFSDLRQRRAEKQGKK